MSFANKQGYCTDSQLYRPLATPITSSLHIGEIKRYKKDRTTHVGMMPTNP